MLLAKRNIVDIWRSAAAGDRATWVMIAVVAAVVLGMGIYQAMTGSKMFSKKARREGRRRRKIMLFEYERDKDD